MFAFCHCLSSGLSGFVCSHIGFSDGYTLVGLFLSIVSFGRPWPVGMEVAVHILVVIPWYFSSHSWISGCGKPRLHSMLSGGWSRVRDILFIVAAGKSSSFPVKQARIVLARCNDIEPIWSGGESSMSLFSFQNFISSPCIVVPPLLLAFVLSGVRLTFKV